MTALPTPARSQPEIGGEPDDDPYGRARVRAWATAIEAGVLARSARLDPGVAWGGGVSEGDLRALEELGARARQEFAAANLGLVRRVVAGFARSGDSRSDLFQEGCLGLMVAVERFDHCRGVRFSTYGAFWIRAFVSAAAARQTGSMTLPVGRLDQLRVAHGVESALAQELGRLPSAAEVALAIGRGERWTADLLAARMPRSLDELDDRSLHRLTSAADADGAVDREETTWARRLLATLDGLERRVVELRLGFSGGLPASRPEVARQLGVPVGRVRRAETRAFEVLRGRCPQALLVGAAS